MMLCFFFSSRRRHTRWPRDWSSDVCSSDLLGLWAERHQYVRTLAYGQQRLLELAVVLATRPRVLLLDEPARSEERRVGKECGMRWAPKEQKKSEAER